VGAGNHVVDGVHIPKEKGKVVRHIENNNCESLLRCTLQKSTMCRSNAT